MGLSEEMCAALAAYERHLVSERDLSTHTVRAYVGDAESLLEHAQALGVEQLASMDLRLLRSWLAKQQTLGKARATMARRATAARMFTAWAHRTGRTPVDVGVSLVSPKVSKSLPATLSPDQARALLRLPRREPTTAHRSAPGMLRSWSCSMPPASGSRS
ncbi:MAG: site-specific integrase [Marmoricola sp.]